ncbi:MAG: Xaa-Pro peptidase family protein, partial [Planctomycetes bacterium]|nr:Xaa-Pro peptidase family protein [Planctomycetota bacterium]
MDTVSENQLPPRVRQLAEAIVSLGVDALLVTDEINVRYLSGFTGDSCYLLVTSDEATILSDGRYEAQIAQQCPTLRALIRSPSELLPDLTQAALKGLSVAGSRSLRVGVEADHLSITGFRRLTDQCNAIQFVETVGVVERLRMIKDESEIEITREAVRVAERAFLSLVPMLTGEWSEREIAHELEAKMRFLGAEGCSFAPIVAAGPAGALPHYQPSQALLGDSDTLLIDWGARLNGYASDLTRTLHRPSATDAYRRAYESVLEAQLAAIAKIGPGVPACEVDQAARDVLKRSGLDQAFKHGLGHGVGLQIHESPRMSSISQETLVSGMIITVEPGVYFDGDFGIRIEDDVLVTDSGCEVLSQLPKGLDDCLL